MFHPSDPTPPNPRHHGADSLRQRAEEILRGQGVEDFGQDMTPALVKLLEELRIHQVELEIQNESLRLAQSWQHASETRFRHLYDLTPVGYLVMDRNGRILHANPAACTCFSQTPEHMKHSVFAIWIDPGMAGIFASHLHEVFTDRKPHSCEIKLRDSDRWLRIDSIQDPKPPMDLLDPTVPGSSLHEAVRNTTCLCALHEITDQKRAETKLGESLAFHNAIIDALPYGFAVINADTFKIEMANTAYGGYHAIGRTCHEQTHGSPEPCNSPEHPCPLRAVKETGQSTVVRHVHIDPDGTQRSIEVHAHPIFDRQGQVVRIIEQCIEITDPHRIPESPGQTE